MLHCTKCPDQRATCAGRRRRVFGRFVRLGHELEREKPGTGLGLYIVRTLVRRLRGPVRVRDHEEGPGTVFEVDLPGGLVIAQETQPHENRRLTEEPEVA